MEKDIRIAVNSLDKAITFLMEQKANILANTLLIDKIKAEDWVIENSTNTYYQFVQLNITTVYLERNGTNRTVERNLFNSNFRKAEKWEVKQHLDFIQAKLVRQTPLPDFYMITVKGESGTKVRHESWEIAVKEATRLAEVTNHRAHIMGVVGIVEPTVVQEPIIEYQLVKK